MGLDSVELIMEFEKVFEMQIPDQEAEKLRTVGDVHNYIWHRLENWHSNKCNSQILSYKLRMHCIEQFGVPKSSFQTVNNMNNLFPKEERRKTYFEVAKSMYLKFPSLILSRPWDIFLNGVGLISILGGLILATILCVFLNYSNWFFLIPVAGIFFTWFLSILLNPKRIIICPFLVREFIQKTLSLNFIQFSKDSGTNRKEVESVINHIILNKLGVDLDEISPEKNFVDDFGID